MERETAGARTWEFPRVGNSGAEPPGAARAAVRPSIPGWGSLPEAKAEGGLRGHAAPSRPIPVCEEKGGKEKKC